MLSPRRREVERLTNAALEAMADIVGDATAGEVASACLSVTMTAILAVERLGGDLEAFRSSLERRYALMPQRRADA